MGGIEDQVTRDAQRRRQPGRRLLGWMAGATIACGLLLLSVAYIALPALEHRPQLLGDWLGEFLGRKVVLRSFELAWRDDALWLLINDLQLPADTDTDAGNALSLKSAEVHVDLWRSILDGNIRAQAVIIRGAHVTVERTANGTWTLAGLGLQSNAATLGDTITQLLATLPLNAVLGIEQATVTVQGTGEGSYPEQALALSPVSAHLHHNDDGVRLSVTAAFKDFPQAPLRSIVRWHDRESDPLAAATFTLNAQKLPVSALPQDWRPSALQANVSIALNGSIAGHTIDAMRGSLKLEQIGTAHNTAHSVAKLPFTSLRALVEFIHDDIDWRLSLLKLQTESAQGLSIPSTLTLTGKRFAAPHALTLDHLPVSTIVPMMRALAPSADSLPRITSRLSPSGRIEDLQLDLSGDFSAISLRELRMQVRGAMLSSENQQIQVGPLDASLVARTEGGSLQIQAAPIRLQRGENTQGERQEANLHGAGTLRWHYSEDELTIDSAGLNLADMQLRMQLAGAVRIPASRGTTTVDLHLHGTGLTEPSIKRYLALELLPAPLTDWLAQSISAGQLRDFRAHLTGSPTTAAEVAQGLALEASFENATLRYLDGWPALTAMNGQFTLRDKQFSIELDSALVGATKVVSTSGQIADILDDHAVFTLQGRAVGRAEQGTAFLNATPLAQKFSPLMQQLNAKGDAILNLGMSIPLHSEAMTVRGELQLNNNELQIQALRSAVTDVNGIINFDANGLTKAGFKANYLQREISMSLDGMLDKRNLTRLLIDGATDPRGLIRHLYDVGALDSDEPAALPLLGRLAGQTHWKVTMDLAQSSVGEPVITMSVQSDLKGMALDLPAPLGKPMHESRPLEVTSTLLGTNSENRQFKVHYGEALQAIFEVAPQRSGEFALHRGALRIGGGNATLPARQGILIDGSVTVVSIDDWTAFITEFKAPPKIPKQQQSRMNLAMRVQLRAQRLVALGAVFDNVLLDASRSEQGRWRIGSKGADIDGTITIGEPLGAEPIDARFERLHVHRKHTTPDNEGPKARISIEPGDLPSMRVVVQQLRYNDIELGLAKLVLAPVDGGLAVREIFALSDAFELQGNGEWLGAEEDAKSRFDLRLHSEDFGRFTKAIGYGDSGIKGGVAEIAIDANWRGSPFEFSLDKIEGALHFRGTAGRLTDVEPGTGGRIFGLLNLTVLPRRLLLLDFKDLYEEGISFELIEGSFALSDGNAVTKNVKMDTETATVELKGRVGLLAQDYDQVMTITPKLSASLPLAPIWLAEKLLNRKLIDSAFAYQYIITGSWLEPQVERIRVEVPIVETQ